MKKYNTPLLSEGVSRSFVSPAAPALIVGLAKGATVGVSAVLAKKVLGDTLETEFPALEPCLS